MTRSPSPAPRFAPARRSALFVVGVLASCGGGGGGAPPPAGGPCGGVASASAALDVADLTAEPGPAPGTAILRFTAPSASAGPVTAYVVRASVRHLTPSNAATAAVVPQSHPPSPAGTPEVLPLTGLEPGQTLQFAVQAVRGGTPGPFSFAAASRVGAALPSLPPNAIPLSEPATLVTLGGYYYLTQDVTAEGTAFDIEAAGVTLDLNGHTITYGTGAGDGVHGVFAEQISGTATTTVRNGKIVQGAGGGSACHGVRLREVASVVLSGLDVDVSGPDAHGLAVSLPTGDVRIDHCTVACRTTVVTNRHFPGVAAIYVDGSTAAAQIDHNRITASPQWGIKLQGRTTKGPALIHHNVVQGTKALVANGYMIGVHKPSVDVFENLLASESRGIHLDAIDNFGSDAHIHDNVVRVQDQTNPEYPDAHWVHGIKVEGAPRAHVHHNLVVGVADDLHAEVRAVDLALLGGSGVRVCHNRVHAIATGTKYRAHALQWSAGTNAVPNDVVVRHNVLEATDRVLHRDWSSSNGGLLDGNLLLRDQPLSGREFRLEYFDVSDALPSPDHRLRDPVTELALNDVGAWAGAAPWSATREWTLSLAVVDGAGAPLRRARVTLTNATGQTVWTAMTDDAGRAQAAVVQTRITNGPTFVDQNPHTLTVTPLSGGAGYAGPLSVTKRTALKVDAVGGTASADAAPPAAPAGLAAHPLSASRALLRWAPASDDLGVAGYLVFLDDQPVGVTDATELVVAGLEPLATHVPSVQAIDDDGKTSPVVVGAAFTMRPEDRGP